MAEPPGRRHPGSRALHTFEAVAGQQEICERSMQQSAESCMEPQSEIEIEKNIGEMTLGGGFFKCCQPQIHCLHLSGLYPPFS